MAEADSNIGKVLQGRYRVLERVASGGMGVVYRGERLGLSRAVAIKFVWPALAQIEQARKRFETEAKAMSRLTHPSCVGVIDFGVEEGAPYLVMDYASGRTLKVALQAGRLPVAEVLEITRQLLGGLAHAHGQGIIHRDIKPDNIVLSETEGFGAQVRILDFGLAKLKDSVTGMTAGFAVGTPSYMSPEQTVSEPVDARSDLYSVGVLLFEMLTGARPFIAEKVPELLHMHRAVTPPKLRDCDARFSAELEAVVAKSLAKLPAARFASAAEFASALDATPELGALPRKAPEETVAARRVVRPRAKPRWILALSAGAGVALLVGVSLWISASHEPPPPPPPVTVAKPLHPPVPPPPRATRAASLETLMKLHADNPQDAEVSYLLGNLYFDRMWWNDGFNAYHAAISRNPAYRQDRVLISNVVKSLISDRYAATGARFIEREIGAAAIPFLEEAAKSKSPNVRGRAARLLAKLR